MQIIADLQLHSKYSRAVSQKMDLCEIAHWSAKKGIGLVTTGDWTHPLWIREIKSNLEEVNQGIFRLKSSPTDSASPPQGQTYFLLSTEISSIYSQGGKLRRVHNLIFSPSFATCDKIIKELQRRGARLMSDGRPIVGISSKDLLEMVLEIDENVLFIPAHIWTPWFSLFGSKSGFDSIEECFGDLSEYIYAIETGLSSDPIMNWQIKELDTRSILSFSDAHSGPKLGREATVFTCNTKHVTCNFSYSDISNAIKQKADSHLKIEYTIEFFPEEGKYHWSGHRNCNIRFSPSEVKDKGIICPVCKQPLTIGVENRVIDLSYKTLSKDDLLFHKNDMGATFVSDKEKKRRPFVSLVPLLEILSETNNHSPIKAKREYERLTNLFASEFDILLKKPYDQIRDEGGNELMKAVQIVRERNVFVDPGYDGVFGAVTIFKNTGEKKEQSQPSLF